MINESEMNEKNVCDLMYLNEMMGGKKHAVKEIMEEFVKQISEELQSMNDAIATIDFASIRRFAHTMKSTVSIVGITILKPVLQEMENLGAQAVDIEKIKELNKELNSICKRAVEEIEAQKHNYV